MRICVSGASGLVGRSLVASLLSDGHEVTTLVRTPPLTGRRMRSTGIPNA